MRAKKIAPGLRRTFLAESWTSIVEKEAWRRARESAESHIVRSGLADVSIQGYDIDGKAVRAARENAEAAGVGDLIHFQRRPVAEMHHPKKYGFIITTPPYGERLLEQENLSALYREIGDAWRRLDSWSMYLITSYEDAERAIGKKADKNRKIYNGMLRTYLYQYMGPKPPRKETKQ